MIIADNKQKGGIRCDAFCLQVIIGVHQYFHIVSLLLVDQKFVHILVFGMSKLN